MRYVLVRTSDSMVLNAIEIDPALQETDSAFIPPDGHFIAPSDTLRPHDTYS